MKKVSHIDAALIMIGSRVLSIMVGLLGIPILLSCLGSEMYGGWAVLLGGSFAFYVLEFGMSTTVIKYLAEKDSYCDLHRSEVLSNATSLLIIVFLLAGVAVLYTAAPLAGWLNLPDTRLLSPGGLIIFLFFSVIGTLLFRISFQTLCAVRRYDAYALISLLQFFISNIVSWIVAYNWPRLDLILISYWVSQLIILYLSWLWVRRTVPWSYRPGLTSWATIRQMFLHGFNLQFSDMMYFVHFQFDKMLIAGFVGLAQVTHYECASRAGQALRSIPGFGLGSFLPTATEKYSSKQDFWPAYLDLTRVAALSAVFLLLLPMAVSPLFLFAWVGQIGYHGRWVFMLLAAGIAISVIAMPVNLFVQAMGRTAVMARLAVVSIIMNVVFSLILIQIWGKEGAAAGTALAISITGLMYLYDFHSVNHRSMSGTCYKLLHLMWPAVFICAMCYGLEQLIEPWVISSRWYMAPAAAVLYLSGAISILFVFATTGRLGEIELKLLGKIPGVGQWIASIEAKS